MICPVLNPVYLSQIEYICQLPYFSGCTLVGRVRTFETAVHACHSLPMWPFRLPTRSPVRLLGIADQQGVFHAWHRTRLVPELQPEAPHRGQPREGKTDSEDRQLTMSEINGSLINVILSQLMV